MKLIISITGASGIIYAKHLLKATNELDIETHVIITNNAKTVAKYEIGDPEQLEKLATFSYEAFDLEASIASGSFKVDAMVIVPASMKTIGAIASGYCNNLVTRAADVHLKEKRKLIIVPRETPLHTIHLENLVKLSKVGAVILPAMPGYYHNPKTIEDLANFITGKILDQIGIKNTLYKRWDEIRLNL
jgi:4-hydroxy-3-polyprenylbenzoate decarboxylase